MNVNALSARQRHFVDHYSTERCATKAARAAGYKDGPGLAVTGSRLLRNAQVRAAIEARQATIAARLEVDRQRVIEELQAAIALAREKSDPAAMIAGWREIARLCGFYPSDRLRVAVEPSQGAFENPLSKLSDDALRAIIDGTEPVDPA